MGAFVPITLGGKEFSLTELPRRLNREWQAHVASEVRKAFAASGPLETADEVMDAIAEAAELWMDLLLAYDALGRKALPDRDWIDTTATDGECYRAIRKVTGVSYPFGADLMRLFPELRPMLLHAVSKGVAAAAIAMAATSSRSTSSAPPSTAGDRSTSKRKSRNRSSSSTSSEASNAASA